MIKTLYDVVFDSLQLQLVMIIPAVAIALILTVCASSIRYSISTWIGIDAYIRITFLGVMIHEIGHIVFCYIFGHKVLDYKLFSPEEDGTLGYVNHEYNPNNFYCRIGNFFIGTGPVWIGLVIINFLTLWLLPEFPKYSGEINNFSGLLPQAFETSILFFKKLLTVDIWLCWQTWVWLVLVLMIGSHIALSSPDLHGAADGFIVIMVLLFGILSWTRVLFGFNKIFLKKIAVMMSVLYGTSIFLSIVLVIFTLLLLLLSLLSAFKRP